MTPQAPDTSPEPLTPQKVREREWEFEEHVMKALTVLREIASGKTQCGRCRKGEWERGERALKMKEAMVMARNAEVRLNAAINQFHASTPHPCEWARFKNEP